MGIVVQPYQEKHESAVKAFNARMRAATSDPDLVFYERSSPAWLPRIADSPHHNEYYVAVEDDVVRGAYALKYERVFIAEKGEFTVACYHHPLSEGAINRQYSTVGSLLLRDALRREPILYALGMGGTDRPLPRMLKAVGWSLALVPFYFRVLRPYRFLRQMTVLRQSPWKRALMDLAAFSGAGSAALRTFQYAKQFANRGLDEFQTAEFEEFPDWADALWFDARDAYGLTFVRDRQTLLRLYPVSQKHLSKISVFSNRHPIGWCVVGERRKDPKYGNLRVGSIVDCWARPEHATLVVRAATRKLQEQGFDLIVSNQSHRKWGRALEHCGFIQAQSNFIFATARQFAALFQGSDFSDFHLNRANGDGLPRNF